MGLFNNFPYMDLSNLNLDFVLKKLKDLTNYTQSAEQAAESAEQSASSAQQSAESAEQSASSAQQSAESAEGSADTAQNYAEHIADPVGGLVTGWLDDNITPTTPPVDASLTIQGAAADAKATGDSIDSLRALIAQGMPVEVKQALDNMLAHASYNDYDSSADYAVLHAWTGSVSVLSITAVFTPGTAEFYLNTPLDDLKDYLVVTAYYDDGTSAPTNAYTLSGVLSEGSNTITVLYGGVSTTFTVTVIGANNVTPLLSDIHLNYPEVTVTPTTNGFRLSNATNRAYAGAWLPLPLRSGYTYKVSFDQVYIRGNVRVSIRDYDGSYGSLGSALVPVETAATANQTQYYEASGVPSDSSNWSDATSPTNGVLFINITYDTAATGDVTFNNLKIIEYLENGG